MNMPNAQLVDLDDTTMSEFFAFESDMERSLGCIPMSARLKLDRCGIKVSLAQWNQFPLDTRYELLHARCEHPRDVAHYRDALCRLIQNIIGDEPKFIPVAERPPWDEADIPRQIIEKAVELCINPPTTAQWRSLDTLQRYALIKLTRAGHESRNFMPALREFGLL
jgi:hypothetical protein